MKSVLATTFPLLFFLLIKSCFGEEITFLDDDGGFFTLRITDGCYTFDPMLVRKATTVEIENGCFDIFKGSNCRGEQDSVRKGTHDLKAIGFDKSVNSVKLCSSRTGTDVNVRQVDVISVKSKPGTVIPVRFSSQQEIYDAAVSEHNKYRRMLGLPDVKGNAQMHEDAQKRAEYLDSSNKFEPTTMGMYGNTIATSFKLNEVDAIKDAVKRWFERGNGTAITSESTTDIGIGIVWDESERHWIINAFYSPPMERGERANYKENEVESLTQNSVGFSGPTLSVTFSIIGTILFWITV